MSDLIVGGQVLPGLVADLVKAAAADVRVGVAEAAPSEVAGAVVLAREVLQVASVRPPGVYALDDVLREYQLSRPSGAEIVVGTGPSR